MSDIFERTAKSLYARGFYKGEEATPAERATQVMAVMEELAEVARLMRRWLQADKKPAIGAVEHEAADVWIAATALLLAQCGTPENAIKYVSGKLTLDDSRGYLHTGGPLRMDTPPWQI